MVANFKIKDRIMDNRKLQFVEKVDFLYKAFILSISTLGTPCSKHPAHNIILEVSDPKIIVSHVSIKGGGGNHIKN